MRADWTATSEVADVVFDAIMDATTAPARKQVRLTFNALADRVFDVAGYSRCQVDRALGYIKDYACEDNEAVLVNDYDRGYYFADRQVDAELYEHARLVSMNRQMERLISACASPAATKFRNRRIVRIRRDLERVQEDIADALADSQP